MVGEHYVNTIQRETKSKLGLPPWDSSLAVISTTLNPVKRSQFFESGVFLQAIPHCKGRENDFSLKFVDKAFGKLGE